MSKNILPGFWSLCFITAMLCATPVVAFSAPLYAAPVKLGWNPANDPSVRGYVVYYGPTNQPATNRIVAGTNLTVTIYNLQADVAYKFYATSYNASGSESQPSNQLLLTPAAISRLKISRQSNGSMGLDCKIAPGTICAVQFSSNLKPGSWRTLTNVTADLVGAIVALDASAARVMQRFYRTVLSEQPLLSAIEIIQLLDSRIQLSFTAPPGAACQIQYVTKSSSTNWRVLAHVMADAEGNVVFIDPDALHVTSRFYRAFLE